MPEKKIQYLKQELVSSKKQHKNLNYKTIRIIRKDKKGLTEEDIKEYVEQLVKTYEYDPRDIAVSAMGVTNDFTLKYYDRVDFYNTDNYYKDKVEDMKKFDSYDYFDIALRSYNEKNN